MAFCKLLFLALRKDLFGGSQVRVKDVGQGGMLVKGEGNVQFVVKGGCVDITSHLKGLLSVSDTSMLKLAHAAASRV